MSNQQREVINVNVGQCGCRVNSTFWQEICKEHSISHNGTYVGSMSNEEEYIEKLGNIGTYFRELQDDPLSDCSNSHDSSLKLVPRTVFVDGDESTIDSIRSSKFGQLYNMDSFVWGYNSNGNNFAKGKYGDGEDLVEPTLDAIRSEVESCDGLQAINITHALGGGTGSGVTDKLITEMINNGLKDKCKISFTVFPNGKASDIIVEPYNCILGMNSLIERMDGIFTMDNEAIYGISKKIMRFKQPSFHNLVTLLLLIFLFVAMAKTCFFFD